MKSYITYYITRYKGVRHLENETVIEIKNLSLSYESEDTTYEALKNINLTINRGEFICIVGSSGCGKSTLLSTS